MTRRQASRRTTADPMPGAWRLLIAAIVAVALIGGIDAVPAVGASPRACQIRNVNTGQTYQRLQRAVDAARSGHRLAVRGLCRGSTVIGKRLAIKGVRKGRSGQPSLSGVGKFRVLTIAPGARVTLRGLVVLRGKSVVPARTSARNVQVAGRLNGFGGAILNRGSLTLIDVQVRRSTAGRGGRGGGGGIYNTGTLILRGATRIRGNFAPSGGGVDNRGTMQMNGSSAILANSADRGGGVANSGSLTMNGSSRISRNGAASDGGVTNTGRLVMNDRTTISSNSGGFDGGAGGVFVGRKGTLLMREEASIRSNASVESAGGGVANSGGVVRLSDTTSIAANSAAACGGLLTRGNGHVTLNDSASIRDNVATRTHGGGVCVRKGRFTMRRFSTISANSAPDKADGALGTYRGGGIYQSGGTLTKVLCGPQTMANVFLNTPDDCRLDAP